MKKVLFFIFCLLSLVSIGQQPLYFNKIYPDEDFFTKGMSIIETDESYVGYGATKTQINYQLLYFFEMDKTGDSYEVSLLNEPGHVYYPGIVGGAMKKTIDGKFVIAFHEDYAGDTETVLMKLDYEFNSIWQRSYSLANYTMGMNVGLANDLGYIIVGSVWDSGIDTDFFLIKTDSLGNLEWSNKYGGEWAEDATNAIQTPDGGYLIGGYFWKPGQYHSMDAMVVKTDSLGNEQWTKYFGNPDVDDDMAFVQMADDGNYLVATVYGEHVLTPDARIGRVSLIKLNDAGDIIWEKKIGDKKQGKYIKNCIVDNNGNLVYTGFYVYTDSVTTSNYFGWSLKTNQNGDSIWMHDYYHFNDTWDENMLYDIAPTSDNGYIAIGSANEAFTQSNMWVTKLDSMGCDTPGCVTGTSVVEFSPSGGGQGEELQIWPNPACKTLSVKSLKLGVEGEKVVTVFDIYGRKVKEMIIPKNKESISFDVGGWESGLYFIKMMIDGESVGGGKVVVGK